MKFGLMFRFTDEQVAQIKESYADFLRQFLSDFRHLLPEENLIKVEKILSKRIAGDQVLTFHCQKLAKIPGSGWKVGQTIFRDEEKDVVYVKLTAAEGHGLLREVPEGELYPLWAEKEIGE